jgi:predicted DNA-binding transcriptional regulator AlpA
MPTTDSSRASTLPDDDGAAGSPASPGDNDDLSPAQVQEALGISRATFWRLVASGYLPAPHYVGPRSPRLTRGQLRQHKMDNQRLPREARELRRQARLAQE